MTREGENTGTLLDVPLRSQLEFRPSFEEVFEQVWPSARPRLTDPDSGPGYLLAAVDPAGGHALHWLDAEESRSHHAIIGRHSECQLRLAGDDRISLRHLLASAWSRGGQPRLRLLDLRTHHGLELEDGSVAAGLAANGSAFARLGGSALLCLRRGSVPWPESGEAAWASIPIREHEPVSSAAPRVRIRRRLQLVGDQTSGGANGTLITALRAPLDLSDLPPQPRTALGVLHLPDGRCCWLRADALDRGVLIGRDDRCPLEAVDLSDDCGAVSRVHLALVRDPTGLWAVDAASTNGTRGDGHRGLAFPLRRATELRLGGQLKFRWVPLPIVS